MSPLFSHGIVSAFRQDPVKIQDTTKEEEEAAVSAGVAVLLQVETVSALSLERPQKVGSVSLKMFAFSSNGRRYHSRSIFESLCTFHPKLVHIGARAVALSPADMSALCKYMINRSGSPELTLALSEKFFESSSIRLLFSTITFTKTLTHLIFSHSPLSVEIMKMFSAALSANLSLRSLALVHCSIHDEGVELFSNELIENHTLLGLDLRENCIDSSGAAALASMLAVNTSLKKLRLSHNEEMGQVGALQLIQVLQKDNKTLQELTLPAECEPSEYRSILMSKIRKSGRIRFICKTSPTTNTVAHEFASLDVWPYR